MVTYLMMFGSSTLLRWRLRRRGAGSDGASLVQDMGWSQWLRRVAPVAAASGLEVGACVGPPMLPSAVVPSRGAFSKMEILLDAVMSPLGCWYERCVPWQRLEGADALVEFLLHHFGRGEGSVLCVSMVLSGAVAELPVHVGLVLFEEESLVLQKGIGDAGTLCLTDPGENWNCTCGVCMPGCFFWWEEMEACFCVFSLYPTPRIVALRCVERLGLALARGYQTRGVKSRLRHVLAPALCFRWGRVRLGFRR